MTTRESKIIEITKVIQESLLQDVNYECFKCGWNYSTPVIICINPECRCTSFDLKNISDTSNITLHHVLQYLNTLDEVPNITLDIDPSCVRLSKWYRYKDSISAEWNLSKPDNLQDQLQDNPELIDFLFTFTQS